MPVVAVQFNCCVGQLGGLRV